MQVRTPFLGSAYTSRSKTLADQRLINLYPELVDTKTGKDVGAFFSTPGLDLLTSLGLGPVRGLNVMLSGSTSTLYAVSGSTVYALTPIAGTPTAPVEINHVQGAVSSAQSNTNTVSLAFGQAVGLADLVVGAVNYNSGSTLSQIQDDKGNVYTTVDSTTDTTQGQITTTFYLSSIVNSPKTITATFTSSGGTTKIFLISGTSWTVPSNWNSANNTIEVIGGGGGASNGIDGGGGSGGGYAKLVNFSATAGSIIPIQIGTGGAGGATSSGPNNGAAGTATWFNSTGTVQGGGGGAGGGSGGGVGSGGSVQFTGGSGGGFSSSGAGSGGGGAAGPNGNGAAGGLGDNQGGAGGGGNGGGTAGGGSPSGTTGAAGGNNSGSSGSGAGGTAGVAGTAGTNGGGGGGGGGETTGSANAGAGGAGGAGTEFDASHGSGGGGGGGGWANNSSPALGGVGGNGALYGGGGGAGGSTQTSSGAAGGNGAQGIIVITYTAAGSSSSSSTLIMDEYSGIGGSSALDVHQGNFQSSPGTGNNAVTSGSVTPTTNGDLVWGVVAWPGASTVIAGNGFTPRNNNQGGPSEQMASADILGQPSAASISATWTLSSNIDTVASIVTFFAASSLHVVALGTIGTASGPVSMINNGSQLAIVDGQNGYLVQNNTLSTLSLPFTNPTTATYQDGFGLISQGGTQNIYQSTVGDLSTWPALNFSQADAAPDNVVAIADINRELHVFKSNTTEIWLDVGSSPFAFERADGLFIEFGCVAPFSVVNAGESQLWLGQDRMGTGMVIAMSGYSPKRVSTHAIESRIATYPTMTDAIAYSHRQEGHVFYVLTFPSGNETWVYDLLQNEWHQRAAFTNGAFNRHWSNCYAYFSGLNIVGDYLTGNLYALDLGALTDNGTPRKWLRSWRALPKPQEKTVRFISLRIDMQTGVGIPDGTAPLAMLRWTDDAQRWSNSRITAIGPPGATAIRVKFDQLGSTIRNGGLDRTFELSAIQGGQVCLVGADLDAVINK